MLLKKCIFAVMLTKFRAAAGLAWLSCGHIAQEVMGAADVQGCFSVCVASAPCVTCTIVLQSFVKY